MLHNNEYIKTLHHLQVNKKIIQKNYSNFLEKNPKHLENKNDWWGMVDVEDSKNLILNKIDFVPYMAENIMIVTMFPQNYVPPHIDFSDNHAAINIPFLNCNKHTVTSFYEYPNNITKFLPRDDVRVGARQLIDTEEIVNTFNFSLTNFPILFRTDKPHSVRNNGNKLRVMLSWRFKQDYNWNDAVEICKMYNLF